MSAGLVLGSGDIARFSGLVAIVFALSGGICLYIEVEAKCWLCFMAGPYETRDK